SAGDLDGDGKADIIASQGQGPTARVRTFRGRDGAMTGDIAPVPAGPNGVRVAVAVVDSDGKVDVLVAAGPGSGQGGDFGWPTRWRARAKDRRHGCGHSAAETAR